MQRSANLFSVLAEPSATKYATNALRGELDNVLGSSDGQHNAALYTAALKLGRLVAAGMLPRPLVERALQAAGEQVHTKDTPSQIAATIASGLNTGTRNAPTTPAATTTGDEPYKPILDWRDRKHWGGRDPPCRHCTKPTPLRDDDGRLSHKICAEQALADQQRDGDQNDGRQVA